MCVLVFFFKQKTAYEMRISDWSSDVCSSDLWNLLGQSGQVHAATYIFGQLHGGGIVLVGIGQGQLKGVGRERAQGQTPPGETLRLDQIGRASCRERVWQYV